VNDTDYGEIARTAGLSRVGARPSLLEYIKDAWRRRDFAITLARYRISAANEENRLGIAWVVLKPLLNAAVYGLLFGVLLQQAHTVDGVDYIPYLIVGVFVFEFFSDSLSDGAKSVVTNAQLVKSLSFPRILLPVASVLQSLFELLPLIVVMVAIVALYGEPFTFRWFAIFPILALMALFNAGVAFIAARITVHFRDFTQILQFITRIMFYSTGIFFSLDTVLKDYPGLLFVSRLNPVHDYIALVRWALVDNSIFTPLYWLIAVIGAVVFFIGGLIYFWLAEEEYGRD
jgi:teichoic acid transport system permease protein